MGIVRVPHPRLDNLLPVPDAWCPVRRESRLLHRPIPLRHAHGVADTG